MGTAIFVLLVVGALVGVLQPWRDELYSAAEVVGDLALRAFVGALLVGLVGLIVWAVPTASAGSLAWLLERRVDNDQGGE